MLKIVNTVTVVLLAVMNTALASPAGSYAGQEQREIKALSPEEIQAYLAGKGSGLARAAELNHYPGPAHVLELADQLQLSDEQKRRTQALFKAMQTQAMQQGKALVELEHALDRQFASGRITRAGLRSALRQIGNLQAEVRRTHLQAHIEQKTILRPAQVAKYDELRGYTSRNTPESGRHAHDH